MSSTMKTIDNALNELKLVPAYQGAHSSKLVGVDELKQALCTMLSEIIGSCQGNHEDWEIDRHCQIENSLRRDQRQRAADRGFIIDKEQPNE